MRGSETIAWQVELAVLPERLEEFRALTASMIATAAGEEGVLVYERFLDVDARIVYAIERYADSQAAVAHLHAFRKNFATAFGNLAERRRFLVFGTPSAELRALLADYGATFLNRMDGSFA